MEDAHATVLSLDDPKAARPAAGTPDANPAFFAVYDGHGGALQHRWSVTLIGAGATVARFAGDTVHQRLRNTEPYKRKEYEASLKRAFLSTDEDLRKGPSEEGAGSTDRLQRPSTPTTRPDARPSRA